MPASNMKIVTLAAAADVLGWDYRFATTLETSAGDSMAARSRATSSSAAAAIRRSTPGASGRRPSSTSGPLRLQAAGIQTIDGRIIGDDQRFDDEGIGRVGVGLSPVRLRRAGRRAPVQRGPGHVDRASGCAGRRPRARCR